jgi:hypothetical protein
LTTTLTTTALDIEPEPLRRRGFALTDDLSTADAGERYFPPRGRPERGSRLYEVATAT